MSSKFLERLDEIREGAPPRLGFGASRAPRLPGMALVILATGGAEDVTASAGFTPDAVLVSNAAPDQAAAIAEAASGVNWGVRVDTLGSDDAASWREGGADILAFSLSGTQLAAVTSKDAARLLVIDSSYGPEELRDINPLPVDAVLVSLQGDPAGWTLQDLSDIGRVTGRVGKHTLAEVSGSPDADTLEALRNAGVSGLAVSGTVGEDVIKSLQESLLNMPRSRPDGRSRSSAILPGSVYAERRPAAPEPDDDDD